MRQLEKLDYRILAPRATHTRRADCEVADCPRYQAGWVSAVDERTDLGQRQAHYIRAMSGRSFLEERGEDGLTRFTFKPGQQCFTEHRVSVEREPVFVRRSTTRTSRRHTAETWVDDLATETDRVRTFIERHG